MITFLTSPKDFVGQNRRNQIRAIRSWIASSEGAEVIVYGRSEGAHEVCQDLGAAYVPAIASSESGLPYFNAIVEHAAEHGRHEAQIYLNCDILLNSTVTRAVQDISLDDYLLVGQRVDLSEGTFVDPNSISWFQDLLELLAEEKVELHGPSGKDFFVFRRGIWRGLAPVVIGRGGYDSALLAFCLYNRVPIIDGTYSVVALHQFHDYGHVSGGMKEVMHGKDALFNRKRDGVFHSAPSIVDADFILENGRLNPNQVQRDRLRVLEFHLRFVRRMEKAGLAIRLLSRFLLRLGISRSKERTLAHVLNAWRPMVFEE